MKKITIELTKNELEKLCWVVNPWAPSEEWTDAQCKIVDKIKSKLNQKWFVVEAVRLSKRKRAQIKCGLK